MSTRKPCRMRLEVNSAFVAAVFPSWSAILFQAKSNLLHPCLVVVLTGSSKESAVAPGEEQIDQALRVLQEGGVVALPTDTLYGLAADALNADAIERVFAIKERPEGLALPVLLADSGQLKQVASEIPGQLQVLADCLWPGAMTLIVKRKDSLPARLTAGHPTVAVRVPDHPVPRELARRLGRPITGTSANISGSPDPQSLAELKAQVGERVDFSVNGGPEPAGTASTIVDLSGDEPRLVREGSVPFSEIKALLEAR